MGQGCGGVPGRLGCLPGRGEGGCVSPLESLSPPPLSSAPTVFGPHPSVWQRRPGEELRRPLESHRRPLPLPHPPPCRAPDARAPTSHQTRAPQGGFQVPAGVSGGPACGRPLTQSSACSGGGSRGPLSRPCRGGGAKAAAPSERPWLCARRGRAGSPMLAPQL